MSKPKPTAYDPSASKGFRIEPLQYLLVAVPAAMILHAADAPPVWQFLIACLAVIPLAGLMGRATENLAETMGAGIGGLLNATFGNAAELIIAFAALRNAKGDSPHDPMFEIVKASLTGSIIGNILLVLGVSMVAGGLYHKKQVFNRTAASMGSTMMALAAIAMLVPTVHFFALQDVGAQRTVELLSEEIAVVLLIAYGLSLLFSLRTHSHLFAGPEDQLPTTGEHHQPEWSRKTSLIVLVVATVFVAVMSELLVGSVEKAADGLGMNHIFVGVIVVAVIGNAAEHSTAVLVAMKNKMDLAVNIAVGSSIQIALFVAPVLVIASLMMGTPHTLDLHFSLLETVAIVVSMFVLAEVAQDGETHWMEGVMLLAVYIVLALAFFNLPKTS